MEGADLAATPLLKTVNATFVPDWGKSGIFLKNAGFRGLLTVAKQRISNNNKSIGVGCAVLAGPTP